MIVRMPSPLWLLALFCLMAARTAAQEGWIAFHERTDLPADAAYDLFQAADGSIWLGTSDGLYRYDGSSVQQYTTDRQGTSINHIRQAPTGAIWCSDFQGRIHRVHGDSLRMVHDASGPGFTRVQFAVGPNDLLYVAARMGLSVLDAESGAVHTSHAGRSGLLYHDVLDHRDTVYVIRSINHHLGADTLQMLRADGDDLHLMGEWAVPTGFKGGDLQEVDDVVVVVCAFVVPGSRGTETIRALSTRSLTWVRLGENDYMDRSGFVGLRSDGSGNRFLLTQSGAVLLSSDGPRHVLLRGREVSDVLVDREGNTWFSTTGDGVWVRQAGHAISTRRLLEERIDQAVILDDGIFLQDRSGGLHDVRDGRVTLIDSARTTSQRLIHEDDLDVVYIDEMSRVWDGERLAPLAPPRGFGSVKDALALDASTYLLAISFQSTVMRFDGDRRPVPMLGLNDPLQPFKDQPDAVLGSIRDTRAWSIQRTRDGIHILYADAVHRIRDGRTDTLRMPDGSLYMPARWTRHRDTIWSILADGRVAYASGGEVVVTDTLAVDGLRGLEATDGLLFIAQADGILRYERRTGGTTRIDAADGLLDENLVAMRVRDDSLVLVTDHHLQVVSTGYDHVNQIAPRSRFRTVRAGGEIYDAGDVPALGARTNDVLVTWSCLAVRAGDLLRQRYRLDGASGDWVDLPPDARQLRFDDLPGGRYELELVACNEDGVCAEPAILSFRIELPVHQRPWFYALLILATAGLVGLLGFWRSSQQRKRLAVEQERERYKREMYRSRIVALRAQMNPHFMFNALNTIQNFILNNDREVASEYLADFADLIRRYLDQSRRDRLTLEEEVETLEFYLRLERLRLDDELVYRIDLSPALDPAAETLPTMLVQPFVENAVKHGLLHKRTGPKEVVVRFERTEAGLVCTVRDNGIGRAASARINATRTAHRSFATSAIDERIRLYNEQSETHIEVEVRDLYDGDGSPAGTEVRIHLGRPAF